MADSKNIIFHTGELEIDFSFDDDGDLLLQLTDRDSTRAVYLNNRDASLLRIWLREMLE